MFHLLIILFIILIMHLAYFLLYKQRGKYFLEKIKCYLKKKISKLSVTLGENETLQYRYIQISFCQYLMVIQEYFLIFWKTWRINVKLVLFASCQNLLFVPEIWETGTTTRYNKSHSKNWNCLFCYSYLKFKLCIEMETKYFSIIYTI